MPVTVFIANNGPTTSQEKTISKQFNINSSFSIESTIIRINDYLTSIENSSKGSVICFPKFKHYMHLQAPKFIAVGIETDTMVL